jgi:hypothetical protein
MKLQRLNLKTDKGKQNVKFYLTKKDKMTTQVLFKFDHITLSKLAQLNLTIADPYTKLTKYKGVGFSRNTN